MTIIQTENRQRVEDDTKDSERRWWHSECNMIDWLWILIVTRLWLNLIEFFRDSLTLVLVLNSFEILSWNSSRLFWNSLILRRIICNLFLKFKKWMVNVTTINTPRAPRSKSVLGCCVVNTIIGLSNSESDWVIIVSIDWARSILHFSNEKHNLL